jgi:hypothetical protein
MSFQDQIEAELAEAFDEHLSVRSKPYGRAWLDESLYDFEFNNDLIGNDLSEFKCGHATYGYKLIAFNDQELTDWMDMHCEKIEKHMVRRLSSLSSSSVSLEEYPVEVNISYRYIEITFKYKILEW